MVSAEIYYIMHVTKSNKVACGTDLNTNVKLRALVLHKECWIHGIQMKWILNNSTDSEVFVIKAVHDELESDAGQC